MLFRSTEEECIKIWDVEMLLGQGESGTGDSLQVSRVADLWLFDECKYKDDWFLGPSDERVLWIPREKIGLLSNPALKHTTMSISMQLDFSKFVHGEDWTKCYSEDVGGK